MTLIQLANFVRIAELQSLSKAAAVIRIAQPALSRQVRSLELEFGTPLLARHAWGVTLTDAGEVLLGEARRLLRDADGARDAVQALSAQPSGRVAVGVPASLATTLLPPLAAVLRRKYPGLRPHFVDGFSAVLHARTLSGDLDLAALYDDRTIGPLATTPLLTETLMLVGPGDGGALPAGPAQSLASGPLILPARPNRLRLIVEEALAARGGAQPEIFEVDSLPAIIAMVQNGVGLTVLPYSTVAQDVARGALRVWDVGAPRLARTLLLVRPLDRRPSVAAPAVEQEIRMLIAALQSELRWTPLPAGASHTEMA
jgi:LysR family nitrogen assimilation transcriptional regulator